VVVAVASGAVLFLVTGNRKYLRLALQILKWAVIFALMGFALLALEKLTTLK